MYVTDLDLDLPEIADDEQVTSPDPDPIGGRYAGVAWGLAERPADHADPADPADHEAADPAEAGAEAARSC